MRGANQAKRPAWRTPEPKGRRAAVSGREGLWLGGGAEPGTDWYQNTKPESKTRGIKLFPSNITAPQKKAPGGPHPPRGPPCPGAPAAQGRGEAGSPTPSLVSTVRSKGEAHGQERKVFWLVGEEQRQTEREGKGGREPGRERQGPGMELRFVLRGFADSTVLDSSKSREVSGHQWCLGPLSRSEWAGGPGGDRVSIRGKF